MSTHKITFRHVNDAMKTVIMQNRGGQQVIDRILKAYGFTSRQAFCNHLGISQSTMANRYARDTFPADWVIICSMETGVSVEWLAFGTDNTVEAVTHNTEQNHHKDGKEIHSLTLDTKSPNENNTHRKNESLIEVNQGGKAAIERIVIAYGFKTRQALADHIGVSKSTLANRYMRDTFPADWIIQCALETGASLMWLTTGNGPVFEDAKSDIIAITRKKVINGMLFDTNYLPFDKTMLPSKVKNPISIVDEGNVYLADKAFDEVTDGKWLVEIEGKFSVRDLTRIPIAKVKVSNESTTFECLLADINVIAKCFGIYKDI